MAPQGSRNVLPLYIQNKLQDKRLLTQPCYNHTIHAKYTFKEIRKVKEHPFKLPQVSLGLKW